MGQFKLSGVNRFNYSNPQAMYADYKNSSINGLYNHQSKIIDSYMELESNNKDISLELPTGSGKTLVGMIIGEFRRRRAGDKVLYLCANNLLVKQTSRLASEDYGIDARPFVGSNASYHALDKAKYQSGDCIAVTTYSALFNSNPFFKDADVLVFDDAHSASDYVASNWTLSITSDIELFYSLIDILKPSLNPNTHHRLLSGEQSLANKDWVDIVSSKVLSQQIVSISRCIEGYLATNRNSNLKFPWGMIRANLTGCNLYISQNELCIRPFVPPTLLFPPFSNAKQRIYMSATPGRSGELERSFGIDRITSLPIPKDWKNKTTGRRFFMFPMSSFGQETKEKLALKFIEREDRSLLMVNSDGAKDLYTGIIESNTNKDVISAVQIENDKDSFVRNSNAVAVIANRLDGIDFPNDECRLEIILDNPTATHIQERFFVRTAAARPLYSERIRSRLTQAFGRCTRSQTDYAVVCILGEDLANTILSPREMKHLNLELQAELQFGRENAEDQASLDDYFELMDIFLHDRAAWQEAEADILQKRDALIERGFLDDSRIFKQLQQSSSFEVKASYAIWNGDWGSALENIDKVLAAMISEELKGYSAYWCYMAAFCADAVSSENGSAQLAGRADEYIRAAKEATNYSSWLNGIYDSDFQNEEYFENGSIIQRIEKKISDEIAHARNRKQVIEKLHVLLKDLRESKGVDFEKCHCELGIWLGYSATNPKGDAEPDPLWIVDQGLCFVAEDKIYDTTSKVIPVRHVREAAGHARWVRSKAEEGLLDISPDANCITVFLTNSKSIETNARIHAAGLMYLNHEVFLKWADKALDVIESAVESFTEIGDSSWRNQLCRMLHYKGTSSYQFLDLVKTNELTNL